MISISGITCMLAVEWKVNAMINKNKRLITKLGLD